MLLCLHNVTGQAQDVALSPGIKPTPLRDIIQGGIYDQKTVTLAPYQILWLLPET
jgi:hypothetical protein